MTYLETRAKIVMEVSKMAKTNVIERTREFTHEGAPASRITVEQQLRRSVMACLLWEDSFYESGATIASRIKELCTKVPVSKICEIAIEARTKQNLRHVPLLLLVHAVRNAKSKEDRAVVGRTIPQVLLRADEPGEFIALYWKDGKCPLTRQMKIGIANAFKRFDEYHLAKYNRDGAVKIRDVMFLTHPKPDHDSQAELFKKVAADELKTPDTWEVALSGGANKKETFERLIAEGNLGYMALLRNLRNMADAGVSDKAMKDAILARKGANRVLPFRYVAAARACPQMEPTLDKALCAAIDELPKAEGATILLVDVSGSMDVRLSGKSDMTRMDAAATLASMWPGDCRVFTFSNALAEVPPRKGMAGVDSIRNSQPHGGTNLGAALQALPVKADDRLIVITDEQSHDRVGCPMGFKHRYMINVAAYKNGVGYGAWTHLDGFSESVLKWIIAFENER